MEEKIVLILNEMSEYLSIAQMKKLQEVVLKTFSENEADKQEISNNDFLQMFLDAKRIEGCSERTIQYYRVTVEHLFSKMNQSFSGGRFRFFTGRMKRRMRTGSDSFRHLSTASAIISMSEMRSGRKRSRNCLRK